MTQTNDRDQEVLGILLEHPFLHDGLTAEGAYNYLLGRTHSDQRQERWKRSSRTLAFWMKKMGFASQRTGDVNKYSWNQEAHVVSPKSSKGFSPPKTRFDIQ